MKFSHLMFLGMALAVAGVADAQSVQTVPVKLSQVARSGQSMDLILSSWAGIMEQVDDRSVNAKDAMKLLNKEVAAKVAACGNMNDATDLGDVYAFLRPCLDFSLTYEARAEKLASLLGMPADEVPTLEAGKLPAKFQQQVARAVQLNRLKLLAENYDYDALERSIRHQQERYGDKYPRAKEYLAKLEELRRSHPDIGKSVNDAKAAEMPFLEDIVNFRLNAVYYDNPEVKFKEFLAVRRFSSDGSDTNRSIDRPANWQGITSMDGRGKFYYSQIVAVDTKDISKAPRRVMGDDRWVGHLDLDFSGDRLMYTSNSFKKKDDRHWDIFELDLKKGNHGRISLNMPKDTDSYDSCYLPDGRIMFVNTSGYQGVPCVGGSDFVGNLHLYDREKGKVRRLTFDQDNNWFPSLLHNGRVMFLRWEYTESAHYFSRVLMHMNPDGSDQKEYYGSNSYWPNSLFNARDIPGKTGMFIGIVSGHHGEKRVGELVLFDTNRGRKETQGAVQKIPGYGKEVPNITRDQLVNGLKTPLFAEPYPLNEHFYYAVSTVRNRGGLLNLVFCDTFDNIVPLTSSNYFIYAEPYPLQPRKKPPVIPDRVNPESKVATAYLADVHLGEAMKGIPKGEAKYLRVFTSEYSPRGTGGHYAMGMESNWDVKVLYGTVPLNEDGSAVFQVPANEPVTVQVLDKDQRSLAIMRSWFSPMPGETLSCIGCHENQNDAAPVKFTMASRQSPVSIQPWYGKVRTFSFLNEVQGVLDRNCISCHNAESRKQSGMLDFATITRPEGRPPAPGSVSYWSLHPYVRRNGPEGDYRSLTPTEFYADTSELVQLLTKGHHGVRLNKEDWDRLITWIDMNVPYLGNWPGKNRYGQTNENMLDRRYELLRQYTSATRGYETMDEKRYIPKSPATSMISIKAEAMLQKVTADGFPFKVDKEPARETIELGPGVAMNLRSIPAGKFVMGSVEETPSEAPMSAVTIDKPFLMGETEVTLEQYRQFDPSYENGIYDMHYKDQVKPGYDMNDPKFPVIRVSWEKAMEFCRWLSKKTGRKVTLPTEAQWEYAARAGSDQPFYFGDIKADFSQYANLADVRIKELAVRGVDPKPIKNPDRFYDFVPRDEKYDDGVLHLAPAAKYKPNAFGLYDMVGNVAEWTRSKYQPYPWADDDRNNVDDTNARRVVRGGSWRDRPVRATASWRWGYPGWRRVYNVGFRVVIED